MFVVVAIAALWFLVIPIFERVASPKVMRAYWHLTMPLFRLMAGRVPGFALLETTGRKTGRRHQVPVGGRKSGGAIWIVAGRRVDYVRNIEANPTVRVRVGRRWYDGAAHLCPDDDARRRAIKVSFVNGAFLVLANKQPLSIRIDLESVTRPPRDRR